LKHLITHTWKDKVQHIHLDNRGRDCGECDCVACQATTYYSYGEHQIDGNMGSEFTQPYVTYQTSSAHTYGNVITAITKYIEDYFPQNQFNDVYTLSAIGHRPVKSIKRSRRNPVLIFQPQYDDDNHSLFMANTLINDKFNEMTPLWDNGTLINWFAEPYNNYYVKYKYNRMSLKVNVMMRFDT
jgi:hypothetical protein